MLVLSRKEGQSLKLFHAGVFIGEIEVHRVSHGGRVTISFDGPDETRVVRAELLDTEIETGNPVA